MRAVRLLPVCLLCASVWGQVYPGGYPGSIPSQIPSGQPGRTGAGGPGSSRDSSTRNPPRQDEAPLALFHGNLVGMDAKAVTVETEDHRTIEFKRTGKTKFLKASAAARPEDFIPGVGVTIEASSDEFAYLTAVNVVWESAAPAPAPVPATAAPAPAPAADSEPVSRPAAELKPPPAAPDPDDPGRPVLRRRRPDDPARMESQPVPETAAAVAPAPAPPQAAARSVAPSARNADEDLPFGAPPTESLIRKAADAAMDFTDGLPDYVCQELIARFQSETSPANWRALDVVGTEVVYRSGREEYRNVTIDGKPTKKAIEDSGGAWSTGEFGTVLISLFAPATAANFRYVRESRLSGVTAKEYAYDVARENSNWTVQSASQTYRPAYSGTVWIDPATSRVLRIEMQAKNLPSGFPTDRVESATDYGYVRLGDTRQYLLPVHSETLSCQSGSNNCIRNVIDFRNYHKFEGQSSITFQPAN